MLLEGLHIPLTTPFHADGRLNLYKFAANVIRYSKSPAQGLLALSPTAGEPTLLDDLETAQALRAVAEAAAPDKVLLAGISRPSVRGTLALAETAAQLGYDAVLLTRPANLGLVGSQSNDLAAPETLAYIRTVADRSPLPLVLASTAALPIGPATLAQVAAHPNILGLLDATADPAASWASADVRAALAAVRREVIVTPTFTPVTGRMLRDASAHTQAEQPALVSAAALARNPAAAATAPAKLAAAPALRTRTRTVGFQVLASHASGLLDSLNAGSSGIAPSFAACAPQSCYEVYAAWKDADEPLAAEKQDRLRAATEFTASLGPAALKFGCDLNGYFGGLPRLPHLPLTAEQRTALQQRMASLRT